MSNKKYSKCTPEQLYLKMLEIGSECISCGTNLTSIKSKLISCNYVSSEDDDTTLKIMFQNSFTHDETNKYKRNYCKAPEPEFECHPKNEKEYNRLLKAYEELEHEYECTWFLTPEAMMNLLRLKESNKNSEAAETSRNISLVAIVIAVIGIFLPMFYDKCYVSSELKTLKEIKSLDSTHISIKQHEIELLQHYIHRNLEYPVSDTLRH